jgi:predicted RND superfamily exporter protein
VNIFQNNFYKYYQFILKFRLAIIGIFTLIFLYLAITMTAFFTHNDDTLWLKGSNEYNKLKEKTHQQTYIQKLQLKVGDKPFSKENINNLQLLHLNFEKIKHIQKIKSPLTHNLITSSSDNEGSALVELTMLRSNSVDEISSTLKHSFKEFSQFYSPNKETLYVYVFSSQPIDYEKVYIPFKYKLIDVAEKNNLFKDSILFAILLATLFVLFTLAFRSIIPSVLGTVFIAFNTLFTISFYQFVQPDVPVHVSILLVAVAVSIMDFVYIYYGWHIMQHAHNHKRSIYYIMMKTIKPIFWTTLVSVVGIGSLIFHNSIILQSIGYNVILSSLIAFVLSFSLLLALLSFFKIKNPYMITKNSSRFFAVLEAKYEQMALKGFFFITLFVFLISIIFVIIEPTSMVTKSTSKIISLHFPSDGLTQEALKKSEQFHNDIMLKFEDDIEDIISIYKYAKGFTKAYDSKAEFKVENINMDFILFDFKLYGIYDDVVKESGHHMSIYLEEDGIDKNVILQWIRAWDKDNTTLLDDVNSLLNSAKNDTINHMIFVVVFILLLISFVIYHITQNKIYALIALIINSTPLVWFFSILIILQLSLSIEILVAMIIMIALSSDATIHFLYYYHRNLQRKISDEQFLERSFIEVGTPIGIGSTILLITFLLLVFANIPTISSIGMYSVVLITGSLIADLLILPVLFIELVKSKT